MKAVAKWKEMKEMKVHNKDKQNIIKYNKKRNEEKPNRNKIEKTKGDKK